MKIQPIKKRLTILMMMLALIPLLAFIIFSITSLRYYALGTSKKDMGIMAEISADSINWQFNTYMANAVSAGMNPMLSNSTVSDEEKLEIVNQLAEQFGMKRGNIINEDGLNITDYSDYSDRGYYQEAMKGNTCVYPPTISRLTGEIIEIISAPIWQNGNYGSIPVGCVYFIARDGFMNEALQEINISENCYAFMIDETGNVAAHVDSSKVYNDEARAEIVGNLGDIYDKMRAGDSGTVTRSKGGKTYIVSYYPIDSIPGWSLAVVAPQSDFLGTVIIIIIIAVILAVIAAALTAFNSIRVAKKIADPIKLCIDRLVLLGEGDLTSPVPEVNTKDETRLLADATSTLVGAMNSVIGDVDYLLTEMAGGNFRIKSQIGADTYPGNLHRLIEAIQRIHRDLQNVLRQINDASSEVSGGSEQVSMAAEKLSQASVEQAASVEELDATIHSISDKINDNTGNCVKGRELVESTSQNVDAVVSEMENLSKAMTEISTCSDEIDKIIKTIEDIAFQTNILALNAAIEAARAGEAGKGFAVVADEVRNLATKSAEAAHDTTELIRRTIAAVENGSRIADSTYKSVHGVAELAEEVKDIVDNIAASSNEQAEMVREATSGFDQISNAVSDNSATAEECASTASMLNDQSATLKELVSKFKLNP